MPGGRFSSTKERILSRFGGVPAEPRFRPKDMEDFPALADFQRQLDSWVTEIKKLLGTLEANETNIQDHKTSVSSTVQGLNKKISNLQAQINSIESQISSTHQTDITSIQASIAAIESDISTIEDTLVDLQDLIDNLEDRETFFFEQTTPAEVWEINHNLGRHPAISCFNNSNVRLYGGEEKVDDNTARIHHNGARSGYVHCN